MAAYLGIQMNTNLGTQYDTEAYKEALEVKLWNGTRPFGGFRMNGDGDPRTAEQIRSDVLLAMQQGRLWTYINGKPDGSYAGDGANMQWATVAAGGYDSWYREWFRMYDAKGLWSPQNPVHFSFHHEQYVASEGGAALAGTGTEYRDAYRRVVSLLWDEGLHAKQGGCFEMCFIPHINQYNSAAGSTPYPWRVSLIDPIQSAGTHYANVDGGSHKYYDIIGSDSYSDAGQQKSVAEMFDGPRLAAAGHGIPWMTGETGFAGTDTQVNNWLDQFLAYLNLHGTGSGSGQCIAIMWTSRVTVKADHRMDATAARTAKWKTLANTATFSAQVNDTTPQLPPVVALTAPTAITNTSVILHGTIDPNGAAASGYFEWGPTTAYGTQTTPALAPGSGNAPVAVQATISGLAPGQTIHYRLHASNSGGNVNSSDAQVQTTSPPGSAPVVGIAAATNIVSQGALLHGTVDPNGLATTLHFEWGLSVGSYPTSTPNQSLGAGAPSTPVSAQLSGLTPGSTVHFRVVASNSVGTSTSGEMSFVVPPSSNVTSVRFGGVSAAFTVLNDTTITATVPAGAVTGPVTVEGVDATGVFTVDNVSVNPPVVSSVTPQYAKPGQVGVQLIGQYFTGATRVTVNGATATFVLNSSTLITFTVPAAAALGAATVVVEHPNGNATAPALNIGLPPTITGVAPLSGQVGTVVTVTGLRMTGVTAVKLGGVTCVYTVVDATTLTFPIPAGVASGAVSLTNQYGTIVSSQSVTVIGAPSIQSVLPNPAIRGQTVTIIGANLGNTTNVKLGVLPLVFTIVDAQHVTFVVPQTGVTGVVNVQTPVGSVTSIPLVVNVAPPEIVDFSPMTVFPGAMVIVEGLHFMGATSVRIGGAGGVICPFTIVSDTTIRLSVPPTAVTGVIWVLTPGGATTSVDPLTVKPVLPPPPTAGVTLVIASLSAATGQAMMVEIRDAVTGEVLQSSTAAGIEEWRPGFYTWTGSVADADWYEAVWTVSGVIQGGGVVRPLVRTTNLPSPWGALPTGATPQPGVFTIKRGDTRPSLLYRAVNLAGGVDDLSGAVVRFIQRAAPNDDAGVILDVVVVTLDAVNGWMVATVDSSTVGDSLGEFEATYPDGTVKTYPTTRDPQREYITIRVVADLDGLAYLGGP